MQCGNDPSIFLPKENVWERERERERETEGEMITSPVGRAKWLTRVLWLDNMMQYTREVFKDFYFSIKSNKSKEKKIPNFLSSMILSISCSDLIGRVCSLRDPQVMS